MYTKKLVKVATFFMRHIGLVPCIYDLNCSHKGSRKKKVLLLMARANKRGGGVEWPGH